MKIAIYGGAFNPIHNGHINLALSMHEIYKFDKILIIPTGKPVHKSDSEFASNFDRLNMCKIALSDNPVFEVSDIELRSKEKSYTYNTVQKLKRKFKDAEFYLIIGGDMLEIFDTWYEYIKLSKEVKVICAARQENYDVLKKKQLELFSVGCETIVREIPIFEVSSSEIRRKLKSHQTVTELLPKSVYTYIKERKLYEE